ncbi:MAG: hypothetical protein WCX33_00010 [Candidatus Shapirobacteria bacterium]
MVLFGIVIFLIIVGGFLVVDKIWLHQVFEIKPGSCLLFENKYCKKIETKDFYSGKLFFTTIEETKIYSPIDGNCSVATVSNFINNRMENAFLIEGKTNDKVYTYIIMFEKGILECKTKVVKKGQILAEIKKGEKIDVTVNIAPKINEENWENFENEIKLKNELIDKLLSK